MDTQADFISYELGYLHVHATKSCQTVMRKLETEFLGPHMYLADIVLRYMLVYKNFTMTSCYLKLLLFRMNFMRLLFKLYISYSLNEAHHLTI